jgi:arylformamidase
MNMEGVNSMTNLMISAHTGTHVDAPSHILADGTGTERLDLECLTGLARVCHVAQAKQIDRSLLDSMALDGVSRLLLRTSNSALLETASFNKGYVSLTEDAAEYLVERGIKFLALDYLSVDKFDTSLYPVHRILLDAGVVILEGVDLSGVPAGDYEMLCLPLKLEGCDGAPARVILRTI